MNPIDAPVLDGQYAIKTNCTSDWGIEAVPDGCGNDVFDVTYAGWDFLFSMDIYMLRDSGENRGKFMDM